MRRLALVAAVVALALAGECAWNTVARHGTVTVVLPRPASPLRFLTRRPGRSTDPAELTTVWLWAGQRLVLTTRASVRWGAAEVSAWPLDGTGAMATARVTTTGVWQSAVTVPETGFYGVGVRPAKSGFLGRIELRWQVR